MANQRVEDRQGERGSDDGQWISRDIEREGKMAKFCFRSNEGGKEGGEIGRGRDRWLIKCLNFDLIFFFEERSISVKF